MTNLGFQQRLTLFLTGKRPCAYLPGHEERVLFVDPRVPMRGPLYEALLQQGFRRAGRFVYRPACGPCQRCVPVRIDVNHFTPNRSQRRNRDHNGDLILIDRAADFAPEHFALYAAYIRHRHPDGGMAAIPNLTLPRLSSRLDLRRSGREAVEHKVEQVVPGVEGEILHQRPQVLEKGASRGQSGADLTVAAVQVSSDTRN